MALLGKFCHKYSTLLCAGFLLLAGCTSVNRPLLVTPSAPRDGRIVVLPISNLSGLPAPLAEIQRSFTEKLRGKGFSLMEDERLAQLMERYRMRDTSGLNSEMSRAFKDDAGVSFVLVTSLELYSDKDPPVFALSARLVSTGEDSRIVWADGIGMAGDDAPGLLGLGLIEDPKVLLDLATSRLAGSLDNYFSGHAGSYKESRGRFKPQVDYVSATAGLDLRNVRVNFALTSSGGDERTTPAQIDVLLSAPSGRKVTVAYAVTGGTATKGKVHILKNGTLVFAPGELSRSIDIRTIDDKTYSGVRTVEVTLSSPVNAVLGRQRVHTHTILENDPPPVPRDQTVQPHTRGENDSPPTVVVADDYALPRVAIMPFRNDSESKYAGDIITLHFLRELLNGGHFFVIEPGRIREKLLDFRIIMYDGMSLPDADLVAAELQADLVLNGKVLDYQDKAGIFSQPKVEFSLQLIDRKTREVAWSSSSHHTGDESVYFFDVGRVNTAHELAAEMARAVAEMTEQK